MFCQRVMIVFNICLSLMLLCVSSEELPPEIADMEMNKESNPALPAPRHGKVPINNPSLPTVSTDIVPEDGISNSPHSGTHDIASGTSFTEPSVLNNPTVSMFPGNGTNLLSSKGTTSVSVDSTSQSTPLSSSNVEGSKEHHPLQNATSSVSPPESTTTATNSNSSSTQNPHKNSATISSAALSLIILGSTIASVL